MSPHSRNEEALKRFFKCTHVSKTIESESEYEYDTVTSMTDCLIKRLATILPYWRDILSLAVWA